jgi:hypothetical protein
MAESDLQLCMVWRLKGCGIDMEWSGKVGVMNVSMDLKFLTLGLSVFDL